MSTNVIGELQSFREFVAEKLRKGGEAVTPEQSLAEWRERQETIASVRRGLEHASAGRSRSAAD
jgi:predicted transcriptional regulator